jgi:hypothetical protein
LKTNQQGHKIGVLIERDDFLKRIAIDMDEVIADFHKKHLNMYNQNFNEELIILI